MSDLVAVLLRFDQTLAAQEAARNELEGVPEAMREIHQAFSKAREELSRLEEDHRQAREALQSAEEKVAAQQEKLKKFQQQVSRVRNQREYAAVLAEIDQARSELRELEAQAMAALERNDQVAAELATRRSEFARLETEYQSALAAWEGEKPALRARLGTLDAELASLRGALPVPIVTQYLRVRDRHPRSALARVESVEIPGKPALWHCSACHYQVRPQAAMELRRGGTFIQCESCRRFLYVAETG